MTQTIRRRFGLEAIYRDVYPRPAVVAGKPYAVRGISLYEIFLRRMIASEKLERGIHSDSASICGAFSGNNLDLIKVLHQVIFHSRDSVRERNQEIRRALAHLSVDALSSLEQAAADFPCYGYMEVGDLIFVDRELHAGLSKTLRSGLNRQQAIILEDMERSYLGAEGDMKNYTLATIMALLAIDVRGKHVIDAGSHEGILAVVAAKLGAAKVVLIEIDKVALQKARKNLRINGIGAKRGILLKGDLRQRNTLVEDMPPAAADSVIVSNIGDWPEYSTACNRTVLQLALDLEERGRGPVTDIVLSGYQRIQDTGDFNLDHCPDADSEFLVANRFLARGAPVDVNIANLAGALVWHGGFVGAG